MLKVKKMIKKYLPKFVFEQIKYIINKPIINYFKKSYKKKLYYHISLILLKKLQ